MSLSPPAFPPAYVCHHNIFLVYNSLKNKTMKTFAIVTNISVFTSMAFLSMLGTLGYLTFQGSTQGTTNRDTPSAGRGVCPSIPFMVCPHTGDLLNNYCDSDPVANVARAVYTLIIMLTYPIELHVTREVTALRVE